MSTGSRARVPTALALAVGLGLAAAGTTAAHAQVVDPAPPRPARQGRYWCPAAVPDGARVRAFDPDARRTHTGTALGWATPAPRVVTTRGDTVALAARHRRTVSEGRTGRRTLQGAIVGWAIGVGSVIADCGLEKTCGEQNPIPLLGAAIGAVVGSRMRRERWRRATDDACPPTAAPRDA